MQRHTIAALAASLLLFPSLGYAETRTIDVGNFHAVEVSSGIRAIVTGGARQSVVAEAADPRHLTDLRYDVRDDVLRLWYDWNLFGLFGPTNRDITVTISTEVLDALEATSAASIHAKGLMGEEISLEASSGAFLKTGPIEGMAYSIEASSGARIETEGLCTDANIEASSGASIGAKSLDCATVSVEVSSGASAEVSAREKLRAEASSGAHATIWGKPSVDHLEVSSGGSVDIQD